MSRYSSDSDSSTYRRQNRRKRRSPSSSSDSSRHRRSKTSKHSSGQYKKLSKSYGNRSYRRSRSRSKNSSRQSRSTSKERYKRSHSREKYRSKRYYKSRSHSKGHSGHSSKYHSRSSSNDSKNSTSSGTSKSSSTGSKKNISRVKKNSSSLTLNPDEQLREKLLKAIKAAESADHQLKQQGVLPKCVKSRNDINNLTPSKPQYDVLKGLNADEFVPKTFKSSKHIKEENFDELNIPAVVHASKPTDVDENSIFHNSFFIEPKLKLERWVKKLYQIRQRAISGEPLPS